MQMFFLPQPYVKPVWVVGNISVGGEGKTPFVMALVEFLQSKGLQPGIVSRGYGRCLKGLMVVKGTHTYHEVGDEPLMMSYLLNKKTPIAVSNDRSEAIQHLIDSQGCDVIISDDGLQNPNIYRDLEFVVMDSKRNIGNGCCLPIGPLRQPASKLNEVDCLVLRDDPKGFSIRPTGVCPANNFSTTLPLSKFKGQTINLMAGIGNRSKLIQQLHELGIEVKSHAVADHGLIAADDIVDVTFMTMKDWVKVKHLNHSSNLYVIRSSCDISQDLYSTLEGFYHQYLAS